MSVIRREGLKKRLTKYDLKCRETLRVKNFFDFNNNNQLNIFLREKIVLKIN